MGLRFRKRVTLLPGLHLNFSLRRGISASIGAPGATHNVGLDGRHRSSVGLPGSGISYTEASPPTRNSGRPSPDGAAGRPAESPLRLLALLAVAAAIVALAIMLSRGL